MPRRTILDSSECPEVEENPEPEMGTRKNIAELKTERGGVFSEDDRGTKRQGLIEGAGGGSAESMPHQKRMRLLIT